MNHYDEGISGSISKYLNGYIEETKMTQAGLANKLGMSPTHVARILANPSNVSLKNVTSIAQLEYSSLSDFIKAMEKKENDDRASSQLSNRESRYLKRIRRMPEDLASSVILKLEEKTGITELIPDKMSWGMGLVNLLLEGTSHQWVEIEITILDYYLNNINENNKTAKKRLTKLIRHRFKVD